MRQGRFSLDRPVLRSRWGSCVCRRGKAARLRVRALQLIEPLLHLRHLRTHLLQFLSQLLGFLAGSARLSQSFGGVRATRMSATNITCLRGLIFGLLAYSGLPNMSARPLVRTSVQRLWFPML